MPRASSRSSAEASESSGETRSRNGAGGLRLRLQARLRAICTSSASVTSRCWAPSCRSRSILRRAASAAATMRARRRPQLGGARRLDLAAPQRLLGLAALGDVEDHAVHPEPAAGAADELAAVEHVADRAVRAHDPVLLRERLLVVARGRDLAHDLLLVVRVDDAQQRPPRARDEVVRGIAGDPLDLVGDQLEPVPRVPGRAVDRAGDGRHQRAQQRVVGALVDGAQAGARACEQLHARERPVQVVVGADVGDPAARRRRDREQPGAPQARVLAQGEADRGRRRGRPARDRRSRGPPAPRRGPPAPPPRRARCAWRGRPRAARSRPPAPWRRPGARRPGAAGRMPNGPWENRNDLSAGRETVGPAAPSDTCLPASDPAAMADAVAHGRSLPAPARSLRSRSAADRPRQRGRPAHAPA